MKGHGPLAEISCLYGLVKQRGNFAMSRVGRYALEEVLYFRRFPFDCLEKVSVVVNKHAGDSFLCVPAAAFRKEILELMSVKKLCRRAEIDQVMHVPRIQVSSCFSRIVHAVDGGPSAG